MASGKEYKISFKLDADVESSFNSVMQKVERDLKGIEKQINDLSGLRVNGNILSGLQTATQGLERDMRQISRIPGPAGYFTDMKNDLRSMLPELREVKSVLEAITRVRVPGNMFGGDMDRYLRETRQLREELERIQNSGGPPSGGGGGGGSGDPGGGGGGFLALGGPALMAGAAGVAAGVGLFNVAEDYQKAMNQIQASTLSTEAEMVGMRDVAKDVYNANIGEGWEQISLVMGQAKQVTGQVGEELGQTTKNAITLQDTFENLDVESSLKTATTLAKQFGISTDEAFNLFAQGQAQGLDYSGEMLDSANEYAVYFKTLGLSAEDMFNVFKSGKESGAFNLDKVGDAVKEFGIRIKDGSKGTTEAMAALFAPDDIDDFIGALNLGGTKTKEFTQLAEKMGGVAPAKDLVAALQKGGTGAEKAYTSILNQMSAGGEILDGVASGAIKGTDAMSQIVEKLMSMDDKTAQAQLGVALFGTQWEDMEATTISALTNIDDTFDQTKDSMGEITKIKYNTIGQAFRGIGRQIQTSFILPLVDSALPALSAFSNWFASAIPKAKKFFSSLGGGPIGEFANGIKEAGLNVQWLFENGFDGEMEGVTANYLKSFGMAEGMAEQTADKIGDIFKELKFGNFSEGVEEQMADVISALGIDPAAAAQISSTFRTVFTEVQGAIEGFRAWVGPFFAQVGSVFMNTITNIQGGFAKIIAAIAPIVAYLVGKLAPVVAQVFGYIAGTLVPQLLAAWDTITPKIGAVIGTVGPLITSLFNIIKPVIDNIVAAFQFAWPFIQSIVTTAIDIISGVVGGLMTTLGGVITFITGVFSGNWAQAWEGIKGIFSGVWEGIKSIAVGAINGVIRIINNGIAKINGLSFDMPEVFGGGHVGLNIPTIPEISGGGGGGNSSGTATNKSSGRMQAFARGGYADRASIFGEAGGEWAIPDKNTPRSRQLMDQAGRSIGYEPSGNGGTIQVDYSPVYHIAGNADRSTIEQTNRMGLKELKGMLQQLQKQGMRVSLNG